MRDCWGKASLWAHLEGLVRWRQALGTPVRESLDDGCRGRKIQLSCKQSNSMDKGSDWEGTVSWVRGVMALTILAVDALWAAALHSRNHDCPAVTVYTLGEPRETLSLDSLSLGYFITALKKVMNTTTILLVSRTVGLKPSRPVKAGRKVWLTRRGITFPKNS